MRYFSLRLAVVAAALLLAVPAMAELQVDPIFTGMSRVDELAPVASPFGSLRPYEGLYEAALTSLFHELSFASYAPGDNTIAMVAIPDNESEYALIERRHGDAAVLVYLRAPSRLAAGDPADVLRQFGNWRLANAAPSAADRAAHRERLLKLEEEFLSDHVDDVPVRCEIALDNRLARRIEAVWLAMLLRTRHRQKGDILKGPDMSYDEVFSGSFHFTQTSGEHDFLSGQADFPSPTTKPGMLLGIAQTLRLYCTSKDAALLATLGAQTAALQARLRKLRR